MTFVYDIINCCFFFSSQSGTFTYAIQVFSCITRTCTASNQFSCIQQSFRETIDTKVVIPVQLCICFMTGIITSMCSILFEKIACILVAVIISKLVRRICSIMSINCSLCIPASGITTGIIIGITFIRFQTNRTESPSFIMSICSVRPGMRTNQCR